VRAGQSAVYTDWKINIRPALAMVGPTAVAIGLAEHSARAWAAGERKPANPGEVARAIVSLAHRAGPNLPIDAHLRAEEICTELPRRAAAVQCFIVVADGMPAERYGGVLPLRERWPRTMGATANRPLLARSEAAVNHCASPYRSSAAPKSRSWAAHPQRLLAAWRSASRIPVYLAAQ
jgi:hypothetical protein